MEEGAAIGVPYFTAYRALVQKLVFSAVSVVFYGSEGCSVCVVVNLCMGGIYLVVVPYSQSQCGPTLYSLIQNTNSTSLFMIIHPFISC